MGSYRGTAASIIGRALVALLVVACERAPREPSRAPRARENTAVSPADSAPAPRATARRAPPAPQRTPSRLERARGDLQTALAAGPFPDSLIARVIDERGRPVRGASIAWSVAVGGGRLLHAEPATDASGLARAVWEAGASAGQQVVMARESTLGAVGFRGEVAVAALETRPRGVELWVGDTATARAVRLDSAGRVLSGLPFHWRTGDEAIAGVSPDGVVTARRAGSTFALAAEGAHRVSMPITIRPVAGGRVIAADGGSVASQRIYLRTDAGIDSMDADARGDFAFRIPSLITRDVELRVADREASASRFHPSRVRLGSLRSLERVRLVLIPRAWTIAGGAYDGREISIDPALALRPFDGAPGFWRAARPGTGAGWMVGWARSRLPIAVAFRRATSDRIDAVDSSAFWSIVRRLESDLGRTIFRPAMLAELTDEAPGLIVEIQPRIETAGRTLISWSQRGAVSDGEIAVRSRALVSDPRVVTHELMHALGFGHTSAWPSVMGAPGGVPHVTPTDVAYAQLAFAVHEAQQANDAPYGVLEATGSALARGVVPGTSCGRGVSCSVAAEPARPAAGR